MRLMKYRPFWFLSALFAVFLTASVTLGQTSAPANDTWGGAAPADQTTESGYTTYATNDSGGSNSVWYHWTAPAGGTLTIDTNNSNFNTYLKLFAAPDQTSVQAFNNDGGADGLDSAITYVVTAGVTYYFAISGYNGAVGYYNFHHSFVQSSTGGGSGSSPSVNTEISIMRPAHGSEITALGEASGGTRLSKDLSDVIVALRNSSNQYWTGSAWGAITWHTAGQGSHMVTCYPAGCTVDPHLVNRWTAGGWPTGTALPPGTYRLFARVQPTSSSSYTEAYSDFTVLPSQPTETPSYNLQITSPPDASRVNTFSSLGGTYSTTGGATMAAIRVTIQNDAGQFWNGAQWVTTSATVPTPIFPAALDTDGTWQTTGTFPPAGSRNAVRYRLRAIGDAPGTTGAITVYTTVFVTDPTPTPTATPTSTPVPTPRPPDNDPFAGAFLMGDEPGSIIGSMTGTNLYATDEAGEPYHFGEHAHRSVWYQWKAPAEGSITVSTIGSNFDTVLDAYTGVWGSLQSVGGNDDHSGSKQSLITFAVTEDTMYWVSVSGRGLGLDDTAQGAVKLNWKFTATASPDPPKYYRPDMRVSKLTGAVVGDDQYAGGGPISDNANRQVQATNLTSGVASYIVSLQNDGEPSKMLLKGSYNYAQNSLFTINSVKVFDGPSAAYPDITQKVMNSSGYNVDFMNHGDIRKYRVDVTVPPNATANDFIYFMFTGYAGAVYDRADTLTRVVASQPDASVGLVTTAPATAVLKGNDMYDGVYNLRQTATGMVAPRQTVTYRADIQNDATDPGATVNIRLQGGYTSSGTADPFDASRVTYRLLGADGTTSTNITTAVMAGTYYLTGVAPNQTDTRTVLIDVRAPDTAQAGDVGRFHLLAFGSGTTVDRVSTTTTVALATPDLLIGYLDEATGNLSGNDDITSTFSANQFRDATIRRGDTSATGIMKYRVRLQNNGPTKDVFRVRAMPGDAGATPGFHARYFRVGTTPIEITADITDSNGYTYSTVHPTTGVVTLQPFSPGQAGDIEVHVTADATTALNAAQFFSIYAYNLSDANVVDRVTTRTWTADNTSFKPDTWIRREDETASVGDGIIYNTDSTKPPLVPAETQMKEGVVAKRVTAGAALEAGNVANYIVTVQNDGAVSDRFKLYGYASGNQPFTNADVKFFDVVTKEDISTAVEAGTYRTPSLNVGARREYRIEVTVPTTVNLGQSGYVSLNAISVGNPIAVDRATTRTWVQGIGKIESSIDEGANWTDVPISGTGYPLTVDVGKYVNFRATKMLPTQGWPAGMPEWSGTAGANGTGPTKRIYFPTASASTADLKTVKAECGNAAIASIFVREERVVITTSPTVWVPGHDNLIRYRIYPNSLTASTAKIEIFERSAQGFATGPAIYSAPLSGNVGGVEHFFIYSGEEISAGSGSYVVKLTAGVGGTTVSADQRTFDVKGWSLSAFFYDHVTDEEQSVMEVSAVDTPPSDYDADSDPMVSIDNSPIPYCSGIRADTVNSGKVMVKTWYWDEPESAAKSLIISSGIATQGITSSDWQNIWKQDVADKLNYDLRGSAVTKLNGTFYSSPDISKFIYLSISVLSGGVLDNAGNSFDADPATAAIETSLRYKLWINVNGQVSILEAIST